ncbi:MAG: UbiA family prenyltransferase [Planctomycetes bacterium]|nr:UbiA family prenyltransferase [Planctomycetota bacterium]
MKLFLSFVRFEHSIFALPFALISMLFAFDGEIVWDKVLWIVICMISARSSAMAFNRIVDINLDSLNPRTRSRELVTKKITIKEAVVFFTVMTLLFVFAASKLNKTCLYLSPLALFIVWVYSYAKRVTFLCHFHLGLSLAIAPVGAWLGVRETLDMTPIFLAASVLLWVASFDIMYALLDLEFDRAYGIYSVPSKLGLKTSFFLVAILHLAMISFLVSFIYLVKGTLILYAAIFCIGILLLYENINIRTLDEKKINIAFFQMNSLIGLILLVSSIIEFYTK